MEHVFSGRCFPGRNVPKGIHVPFPVKPQFFYTSSRLSQMGGICANGKRVSSYTHITRDRVISAIFFADRGDVAIQPCPQASSIAAIRHKIFECKDIRELSEYYRIHSALGMFFLATSFVML